MPDVKSPVPTPHNAIHGGSWYDLMGSSELGRAEPSQQAQVNEPNFVSLRLLQSEADPFPRFSGSQNQTNVWLPGLGFNNAALRLQLLSRERGLNLPEARPAS